VGGLLLIVV